MWTEALNRIVSSMGGDYFNRQAHPSMTLVLGEASLGTPMRVRVEDNPPPTLMLCTSWLKDGGELHTPSLPMLDHV